MSYTKNIVASICIAVLFSQQSYSMGALRGVLRGSPAARLATQRLCTSKPQLPGKSSLNSTSQEASSSDFPSQEARRSSPQLPEIRVLKVAWELLFFAGTAFYGYQVLKDQGPDECDQCGARFSDQERQPGNQK